MALEPITGTVAYEVNTTPVMDMVSALRALEKQSDQLAGMLEGTGTAAGKTDAAFGGAASRTLDMNAALQKAREILGSLTAVFESALDKSSAFGHELGQVATLSTEVRSDLQGYQEQVLALSSSMGIDGVQAANTFYEALSSGAASDAAGGLKIAEVAMKAAVGGATEAAAAVDGITTSINAWGLEAGEAGRVSDVLFKAVAVGKMTFGELSSSMFQAAPLAASLGVELEEVAAAATTITKSGAPVNVAMTQVRSAMTALLTPGEELQTIFDRLSKQYPEMGAATGQAALDAFGFHKTLALVRGEAESMGMALPTVMGRIEAVGATLALTGQNAEGAVADLDAMRNSAGETDAAYAVMAETFEFSSNQLRESSNAVLIELGTTLGQMLVPAIKAATDIVQGMLEGWQSLDEGTKQMIITIGGLIALVGSGIGVFMSLQATWAAIGPLFATSAGGIGVAGAALAALPILAVIIGIGALVKGVHDLNAKMDEGFLAVQKSGQGWDAYVGSAQRALDQASGLAGLVAGIQTLGLEGAKTAKATVEGGEAWLQYGLGVDQAVLKGKAFGDFQKKTEGDLIYGRVSAEQYKAELLALADAESVAAGKGHVLSEAQQVIADKFAEGFSLTGQWAEGLSDATVKSEEYQNQVRIMAEAVAAGDLTHQQATEKLIAYGEGLEKINQRLAEQAEAQGVAEGALKSYSAGFKELFDAGSQWVADTGAMTAKVEESWNSLSSGVQKNLDDQWQGYQKYQDDLAAARSADAAAAADAAQKRSDAEAGHLDTMAELDIRMGEAKNDRQKRAATRAIEKENEKLQGILAATESVGGANVAKVEEQYRQQVSAQREALAQMIVDHVNSMVLMGQTSEETAKTIFATLRDAYPGVEVLSPVADAHATLMATIRDSTDESSASQVESIARLPEALDGALGLMQETAGEYKAELDTWKTADEQLAASVEDGSTRRQAADQAAVTSALETGDQIALKDLELNESSANRATETEGAMIREQEARMAAAGETEVADQRIRDSSSQVADTVATDAQSIEGSSGLIGAGYQMAADEAEDAAARIGTGMSSVSSGATNLTAQTADIGTRMAGGFRALLPELEGFDTALKGSEKTVKDAKAAADEMGRGQQKSFEQGGTAAQRAGEDIETSMDVSRESMVQTQSQAEDLIEVLESIPTDITITAQARGFKVLIEELEALRDAVKELIDFANRMPKAPGAPGAPAPPGGPGRPRDDAAVPPLPPEDMLPPGSGSEDAQDWAEGWTDAFTQTESAHADMAQKLSRGFEVNANWQTSSPALEWERDGLAVTWAIRDLYDSTADPVIIVTEFDASQFDAQFATARQAIVDAQAEVDRLNARLQATFDAFVTGSDAERGSLMWLFREWGEEDFAPNFGALMTSMNLPLKTLEEFQQHWETLGPEEQMDLWKRLYDDLKRLEKERHDERVTWLKDELKEAQERGKGLYAEQLEDRITEENEDFERNIGLLEERDRLLKRQYEDWKDGVKGVSEATRELQQLDRELARTRQEHVRAQTQLLKEQQKLAEEYETTAHDRVMDLLDEEEERLKDKQQLELDQLEQLATAEDDRHQAAIDGLDAEADAIKGYMEEQEQALRLAKLDLEDWVDSLGLADLKADLKAINDAIRDIPSGRDLAGGGRGQRAKPEDMVRVSLTQGQRDVLQQAVGAGVFTEEDARLAQIGLQQGRLRIDYLRRLLELTQKHFKAQADNTEAEIEARRTELEQRERQWKREKETRQEELDGIEARRTAEGALHTANMDQIEARRTATETRQQQELDALDGLRDAEQRRHEARMKQLEEEFAMAIMIAEGLSPEAAAARIAQMRAQVAKAIEEANRILAEIERRQKLNEPGAPLPGGGMPVPGKPVPGGEPPPPPPPPTDAFGGLTESANDLGAVMSDTTMTLREFLGMIPADVRPGPGQAGIGGGALLTTGDTVKTDFWGPVYVEKDSEPDRLLRKSLGAGWGRGHR